MIWRPILARSGPVVLLALIAVAIPNLPAPAQELTTEERLDRIERDLSMLQRQVYSQPGGAPEMGAEGPGAADLEVRMERLEQQMRDLTGRVEEMTNRVDRLGQRVEQIDSDIAARLGQGGPVPAPAPALHGPRPVSATEGPPPPGTLTPPGMPGMPGMPAFSQGDTLTPPTPLAPRSAARGGSGPPNPPQGGVLPSGPASAQYNFAFGLLKEANYPAAAAALREFVRQHPNGALAGDAQYWLGETYYARRQYHQAARAFAAGYRRYPKGAKAPEDLLRLGMSLARGGQHRDACLAFAQLDHAFPHSAAVRARSVAERQRLACASGTAAR
ncbi:MAG: tol-pal system protein YbgF [Stellaceae bacterium]